ncbi:MAG TPA: hypothetical protein VK928_09705, partial [Longimicrobiales bacterium]|nr:hypothetical protein [Longimicrobiales bacterium]
MRTLLVSHSDAAGGAARACFRLHRALREHGTASEMLVRHRGTTDPHVHAAGLAPRARSSLAHRGAAALAPLHHDDGAFRSYNLLPSRWARRIDRAGADVVNVHWVGAETLSIADIGNIRSPLVLTLH